MKYSKNFDTFNFTIFLLIPFFLTLSVFIADVFFSILFVLVLYKLIKKSYHFDTNVIFYYLLFFHIVTFISASTNIYSDLRLSGMGYIRFLLFYMVIVTILNSINKETYKNKIIYIFVLLLFLLLDSLYQFFSGKDFFGNKLFNQRVSGYFGDDLVLGSFFARILPILIFFTILSGKNFSRKENVFYMFFYTLSFIIIYLSGERTAVFMIFFFFFFVIIFLQDIRKLFLKSLFFSVLIIFIISLFNLGKYDPNNRIIVKTSKQIVLDNSNRTALKNENLKKKFYIYSKHHEGHLLLAYDLFKKNIIFGTGVRGFKSYCRDVKYISKIGQCTHHPHNILFQILSELGLIGFTFYIIGTFFIIFCFFKIVTFKRKSEKAYQLFAVSLIGITMNFIPFLPSGNFFNSWLSYIFYMNFGIFSYSFYEFKKVNNK